MALDTEKTVKTTEEDKTQSKSINTENSTKKKGNGGNNNKKKSTNNNDKEQQKEIISVKNDENNIINNNNNNVTTTTPLSNTKKKIELNGHPKINGHHTDAEKVISEKDDKNKNKNNHLTKKQIKDDSAATTTMAPQSGTTTITDINESELEIIQDAGFTVQIISPGTEPLSIQVSSMELVQEIHQLLMDREDTCHRTCFSLQLNGVTLDNFAELKNIDGLKEDSIIKVVEEPYTMREARIHVRHVRDLLKSMDPGDAYNGIDCSSLTFLHTITGGDLLEKKKTRPDSVDCTPPDYIMPGSVERPLLPLQPSIRNNTKQQQQQQTIKVLTTSAWNPPPGPRKLHGDLMYLYVVTTEDKRYHISACPKGFYLNQSTDDIFNPKPDNPSHLCHSLIDLLSIISQQFKRCFIQMQKKRTQRHPFERVATPYQLYTWIAPQLEHTIDAIRAEDTFSSKLGYEEHIPGQTRDWNEELQTTRELPRKNLPERLLRERAIFKVHSDFVTAATRGAMAVIDGNVMAINPGEDSKMQMFIWNNIFFSLGFDVRDHYIELGGDAAAFVAPRNDLYGVRVYSAVDIEGLYTLGTVVIDYRGYRVTAQSIIPGILEREQEQSVVYGSIDFGKTVLSHPKYLELLQKAGQHLKILPHSVFNEKLEKIELCSSVECKGIIGNDGRHYILDLLRTFPPDVNFLKLNGEQLTKDVKAMGFPIEHKHKLCCLRQELLEAFVEDRYVMFIKYAAYHLQQLNTNKKQQQQQQQEKELKEKEEVKVAEDTEEKVKNLSDDDVNKSVEKEMVKDDEKIDTEEKKEEDSSKNNDTIIKEETTATTITKIDNPQDIKVAAEEAKKIMESITGVNNEKQASDSKDVVQRACTAVGSLKEYEFDLRFNPDVFSPGIKHVDQPDLPNSLKKQKQLVKDAAEFLLIRQIPTFINDCLDHSSAPMDGTTLTETLHSRGINIRYLGKVTQLLSKIKQLEYLHTIAVSELILRSAKHIFIVFMQNTDMMCLSSAISHFLNCFLTTGAIQSPLLGMDELHRYNNNRRKNKRRGGKNAYNNNDNNNIEWSTLTQKLLWQQIKKELKLYWDYDLLYDNIDTIIDNFKLQKISLLRAFCLKIGLQILIKEYNFDMKNKSTFNEDDILNIFPIVKHINPRATDAYNFYTTGRTKIQQGYFKEGFELISEALNLLNNVYGAMHAENAQCLRMLARLSYIMGDPQEALAIQQRAVLMSERVNGIDHPYTISEYTHLALYCFANSQISTALKLLYRARYLALLICGENHPDIALLDSNISLILHAVGEYELSLRFLEHALGLNIKYYGEKSLKVAVSYHLVARTQSCMGDFRSALNNEKETYAIYKQQLGESHEKTQESSECLKHLTQQAVVLQKKMNDIYSNGKLTTGLPPIHIQPPSMGSVLDMLNAINGILFVQISPKDIANLKNEIEKRQMETDVAIENQEAVEKIISSTRSVHLSSSDDVTNETKEEEVITETATVDLENKITTPTNINETEKTIDAAIAATS